MNTCHKIAAVFLSFGTLMGAASAQEENQTKPLYQARDKNHHAGIGRKMQPNTSYYGYCEEAPCSNDRQVNRMSHHDRKMLRQQVNEARKSLYPENPH